MITHDDLTDDAPDTVPWLLFGVVVLLAAIVAFTVGDPGDKTACHVSPAVGASGSGSGAPAVEPDPDCSQEVGR